MELVSLRDSLKSGTIVPYSSIKSRLTNYVNCLLWVRFMEKLNINIYPTTELIELIIRLKQFYRLKTWVEMSSSGTVTHLLETECKKRQMEWAKMDCYDDSSTAELPYTKILVNDFETLLFLHKENRSPDCLFIYGAGNFLDNPLPILSSGEYKVIIMFMPLEKLWYVLHIPFILQKYQLYYQYVKVIGRKNYIGSSLAPVYPIPYMTIIAVNNKLPDLDNAIFNELTFPKPFYNPPDSVVFSLEMDEKISFAQNFFDHRKNYHVQKRTRDMIENLQIDQYYPPCINRESLLETLSLTKILTDNGSMIVHVENVEGLTRIKNISAIMNTIDNEDDINNAVQDVITSMDLPNWVDYDSLMMALTLSAGSDPSWRISKERAKLIMDQYHMAIKARSFSF
jgi:hypothetical protein